MKCFETERVIRNERTDSIDSKDIDKIEKQIKMRATKLDLVV